jgi:DNA-binding NarL/FixJ family response regulator
MPVVDPDPRPLILLVEHEVLARVTLASMLESGDFRVIPVASADEALEILANIPDIGAVVTDLALSPGGLDGLELARSIWEGWHIGVVIASTQEVQDQADVPPGTYVLAKPLHHATLIRIVQLAVESAGHPILRPAGAETAPQQVTTTPEPGSDLELTPRLRDVLKLLMQGKSNREIAQELNLSENTVKVHMAALFRALGVSSRTEAALAGARIYQSPEE